MLVCWMLSIASASAFGTYGSMEFNRLTNRDGLSNTQVNAILKDSHGYVWLGTQSGLNRFDGFRMKTFFCDANNPHSIPNNLVDEIQEDIHGDLWIHTSVGYCVFIYDTEQFDRKPEALLQKIGVEGAPQKVFIDSKKNMWISVYGKGIYFVDAQHQTAYLFLPPRRLPGKLPRRLPGKRPEAACLIPR